MEQTYPSSVQDISGQQDKFGNAKAKLNDALSVAGERAKDAARYANETVHTNPWTSVGVGFGVGVVIGALIALAANRSSHY